MLLAFLFNFAYAQDKPTLQKYIPMDRPAPKTLKGGDSLEEQLDKQINEAISDLPVKKQDAIKKALRDIKGIEEKIEEFKRLRQSMAINEEELWPIPHFFFRSKNTLRCNGIEITDAAQMFKDDGSKFLFIKFVTPIGNRNNIPKSFLNKDMRASFAVYTNKGREVAFYRPVAYGDQMRYQPSEEYLGRWLISKTDGGEILDDIRCADRRHDGWLLNADGEYSAFPERD